tara:strand:+ start:410 stop:547 length:138 start_codon:yes stop_codon:yes gene_type:complete
MAFIKITILSTMPPTYADLSIFDKNWQTLIEHIEVFYGRFYVRFL